MALPYATETQLKLLEQKTKAELDKKTANINLTVDTLDDMEALITKGSVTDGQICYCKEDKKLYVLKDNVWSEVGGGKSVPPMLNLIDFETGGVRTTITEEEYNNYLNNLYSSVYFFDSTLGNNAEISTFFPEFVVTDIGGFTIYKVSMDEETNTLTPTHLVLYGLKIGEKDAISGNYPITIEKRDEFPLGSGSGSSTSSDSMHVINKKETNGKITITEAEFDNLAKDDYELAITTGNDLFVYDEKSVTKDSSTGSATSISFSCSTFKGIGQLILINTYGVEFARNNLVSDITSSTSLMTKSKLFNKKVMTYDNYSPENILPCTASDNGKVLSVVNGEAQWAKIDVNSYPYITGRINASDTQTSSFPETDSETRVVTVENLDLSKLLNARTIIVDADADASEVFNIACGAYGETEGIGTYVSSISCDKKTNNLFFFYINMDIQTSSLIIKRKTIPTSTTTITFED